MPNYNRVILMGHATRDPQLTFTQNNNSICELGIAVNERWKDRDGNQREEVSYIDCKAFGKTSETINQYIHKGDPVHIEGRLKQERWQDKEGNNRSKVVVNIDRVQFLGSGNRGGQRSGTQAQPPVSEPPPPSDEIPF